MGKVMAAQKVYRGVSGGVLPDEFWTPNEFNVSRALNCASSRLRMCQRQFSAVDETFRRERHAQPAVRSTRGMFRVIR
eukprot:6172274-Pleurochrysis_carterae.AAC.4